MTAQERLLNTVLEMDNDKFYTIEDGAGLLDGFITPLPGIYWKLLLRKEIKVYISSKELILNESD